MKTVARFLTVLLALPVTAIAWELDLPLDAKRAVKQAVSRHVIDVADLDSSQVTVRGDGIHVSLPKGVSATLRPGMGTDLYLNPSAVPPGATPISAAVMNTHFNGPVRAVGNHNDFLNAVRIFFNSTSGGFGFRASYDRRLTDDSRMIAGAEFLSYGPVRGLEKLGDDYPADVTRISLVSFPLGLQKQFGPSFRVVPHVGIAAGPALRFDHHALPYSGWVGPSISSTTVTPGNSLIHVGLPLTELPTMSLTVGGHVEAGVDVRVGKNKTYAVTVDGRYSVVRFTDALGQPGDFGGLGFTVGFGKSLA